MCGSRQGGPLGLQQPHPSYGHPSEVGSSQSCDHQAVFQEDTRRVNYVHNHFESNKCSEKLTQFVGHPIRDYVIFSHQQSNEYLINALEVTVRSFLASKKTANMILDRT